ncbi:hypothetical protein F2P79_006112 [Pimephales promelas]|nr:hypothetical protein F2P79_006112 [Pimephales promelas]
MEVVSNRGPQFMSKFWREFCKLPGATAVTDWLYYLSITHKGLPCEAGSSSSGCLTPGEAQLKTRVEGGDPSELNSYQISKLSILAKTLESAKFTDLLRINV